MSQLLGVANVAKASIEKASGDIPPFGIGNADAERSSCKEIQLFIACFGFGGLSVDKRRVYAPKDLPVKDIREVLSKSMGGKKVPQDVIADENFFRYDEEEPLWRYSNKCNLNVSFFYSDHVSMALRQGVLRDNIEQSVDGKATRTWSEWFKWTTK